MSDMAIHKISATNTITDASHTKQTAASSHLAHPAKTAMSQTIATHTISTAEDVHEASSLTPADGASKMIRTTCPYCGVGCGVLASVNDKGVISVKGDPEHPANFGKLCSKGSALAQTLGTERRLIQPYYQNKRASMQQQQPLPLNIASHLSPIKTSDKQPLIENTDWDTVLGDIAKRLNDTIDKYGRDSIMFYVSGQLLTEDYYVANKFIKGFIGNNNIDSNSRLCMSSAVAGHKRAFGADLVPGNYEDFETCDLLVLVGSNMAWCHPILFGRFLTAKKLNPNKKLIVIDPRRTDACEFADLHLPIAAGTDTHLYNGLLRYLEQHGCQDKQYTRQCVGVDEALYAAKMWTIDKVASACQVSPDSVRQFYEWIAANDKTVTAFSMGVNQSKSGTDKVNTIINTHLFTGRVGQVGASPFSLTGQPNAMGGREVGALANLLAAHLDLDNREHRQLVVDFWASPQSIAANVGVKACDAADAILDGRIKAIWIMATNPVVSLPEADRFRQALAECDLVIVSDCSVDSDTVKCADIVLPAQGWGEKSGTVTNSERRISRQRSLLPATGMAKPDWWILSQVAKRMGFSGFDYQHPSEIFNEHVALTAYGNDKNQTVSTKNQPRYLNLAKDLSVLMAEATHSHHSIHHRRMPNALSNEDYDMMRPFQWGGARISMTEAANERSDDSVGDMTIQTASCIKAQLIAITPADNASVPNRHRHKQRHKRRYNNISSKLNAPTLDLRLITGRLRDQWHTMTRTGLAPQLNQHQSKPVLTLHPDDAAQLGVETDDFVQLHRQYEEGVIAEQEASQVLVQVAMSDVMRVGDAFMSMHWSNAFASFARMGTLIPTVVDPHSGQPELKNSAIRLTAVPMHTFGKILVHPDWQDTVIVQLRTILDNFEKKRVQEDVFEKKSHTGTNAALANQLPALTWNLSRQMNSVLIHFASPNISVSHTLNTSDFWQQLAEAIQSSGQLASQTHTTSTAFTINKQRDQLRFIMTQSIRAAVNSSASASTDHTDNSAIEGEGANEKLIMAVYLAPTPKALPSIQWLDSCFADANQMPVNQRYKWLLAGRPASGYVDPGPLVCSCMSVGENRIIEAITKQGCTSAAAVGEQCRAGTNCGSCVGQINDLITKYTQLESA
jgi:assimilatory nitrate reductase catalytic subunit